MAYLLSLCLIASSVIARSLINYRLDNREAMDAGPADTLDQSTSDHRQLQTCALNMQWTTTHSYTTFYYQKCTGSYTIEFSPFTYNTACTAPDPDPNLYTNLYTLTQVDPCTTPGVSTSCTFQINTAQTMFDTNGDSITFNTCDSKYKTNYAYKVEYFYRGSDATFIKDGFYIVLQGCDTCVWSSITTASTSLGHIYYPDNTGITSYSYDAILTQNPDCGYIESDYKYSGRMTDLTDPSLYKFNFGSSSFKIENPNLSNSILPITYDLQWTATPSNFCPTNYLSPPWINYYVDFKVTIYCQVSTLSVSSFSTSYTAYVGTDLNIPYPPNTQSPTCYYPLEVTSYLINSVASATKSWFIIDDVNQRLTISSATGLDVGSYTISITFGTRDTIGDYKYKSVSSFTLIIKCVLSSVTPSFTMAPSYSANNLNTVLTITAPTFTQTPNCNIVPVFTQKVNGSTTSPGTWLTSASSTQTLIMPTKAADDGTYAFENTWKFTDSNGLINTQTQSHNVIIDVCSGATYTVPSMSDLILLYQGPAVSYAWTNFQDSVAIATAVVNACGVWSYTWAPTGVLATDVTATTVTVNNFSFRWVNGLLSDFTQALPYASTLNGYQNGILKSSVTFNTYFYCKVTTFTATSATTAYSASVDSQTIVPFPTFTQTPNCGLTVSLQSYTVNSVSNPSFSWLSIQTSQFSINSSSADVGVYVFVITWKITDTQGTVTTNTSTFTVTISCVLVSITPSSSMAATYTSNALLSPYTITFPTFVQTPACGYVPAFQYSLDAVVAKTARWLTTVTTNQMQVTPQSGLDDGTYTMAMQWTFTDQLGAQTLLTDSFTLVIDVCSGATYTVPTIPDVTLAFQGPAVNQVWPNFVDSVSLLSGVAESCGKWTYSWMPPSTGNIASAVTKTTVATNIFSYDWTYGVIADFNQGMAYPNTIKGYLNGVYKTSASFNMYFTCQLTSVIKIQDSPQLVEYTIGGNPVAIPLSVYIQTPQCELNAEQSLSVNFKSVIPTWLTPSSTQIVVNSVNAKDEGLQYVIVQQVFSDGFGFVYNDTDTIVVMMTRPNTAPYFITPPTAIFTITHGRDWQYELPQSTDDEDDLIVVSFDLPNIVTFSSNTLSIPGGLTNTTQGPLQIGVTLTDPDGASSNYAIKLEFESPQQNKTVVPTINNVTNVTKSPIKSFNKTAKPANVEIKVPHPEIQSIKQTGIVTITFDQDLIPIKVDLLNSATIEVNGQVVPALQLSIQPGYYSDIDLLRFNYTVTAFTARKLTLLLLFQNPNYVSNEQADPDLLKIQFNDVTYFFTQFAQTVESGTQLVGKLPRIFQGQVSAQFVEGMNSLSQSSSYLIGGNMAMNIMLAASLNQLWAMIQTQQIIVLMPLFAINMPQNAQLFFGFIMQIASFDILPTDSFYDEFFDIAETEAINQNFDNLGFNSMFFLYNMGSLSIAWFVIPVLIFVGALLRCCMPLTNKIAKLKSLHKWIDNFIFWNYPIGTFNNSASIIYMCSLINLLNIDYSTRGCLVSTVLAIVSIAVALILPLIYVFVMVKNRYLLNNTAFKDTLGAMYEGLNTKRPGVALLPLFFFVRRFILALIVIFNDKIVWQLLAMHLMFLTQIAIMGFVKPFETPRQALTEYVNEVLIMLLTYCMILFTDFNDDFDSQIQIGYVCCSFVALHLLTNFVIMLSESCRGLKMRVIRFKNRKNIRQVIHTNKRRFQKDKDAPVRFKRPPIVSTVTATDSDTKQVPPNPVQQHVTFAQLIVVPDEGFTFVKRERKASSFGKVGSIKSSLQLPSIKESNEEEERKESDRDVVSEIEKEMREIYDNPRPAYVPSSKLVLNGGGMGSVTSLLDRVLVNKPQSMASIVTPQNKKDSAEENEFVRWAKNHQMPGSIDTVDKQIQEANQRILVRNTANIKKKFSFTKISDPKVAFTQKQLMMFKPEL